MRRNGQYLLASCHVRTEGENERRPSFIFIAVTYMPANQHGFILSLV
ncbi:hypothetical protein EMIT019CA3_100020 [Bacillus pseudomycoides]